jgi:hypothetical protein
MPLILLAANSLRRQRRWAEMEWLTSLTVTGAVVTKSDRLQGLKALPPREIFPINPAAA